MNIVFSEKQQIIKKSGLLEYYESQEKFSDVAGLENLKEWLKKRSIAFTDRAHKFGLPAPRGVLLLGRAGLRQEPVREGRLRLVERAAAAIRHRADVQQPRRFERREHPPRDPDRRERRPGHPVGRRNRQGARRRGKLGRQRRRHVGPRVRHAAYLALGEDVAGVRDRTANDISHLPPELLRKGRLDEIFFVDLPTPNERREIFRIHIEKRGRDPAKFDLDDLARVSEGFNGAEIEEAIISALFDAFSGQQELNTEFIKGALPRRCRFRRR